ncbi:GPI ethanolamine phosphate transferase 1 isoform X2 [Cephus cinctus]|uniref:GPI ethanolamine phosphate transferase 1 n=1 Tax=Cephus cinctus TaxID=211228 RepID=A0AAJ7BFR5_CEPCN|nr:GPI ethanolamine phosphate transferase 1 isoform X2 [Cephus cinctus]
MCFINIMGNNKYSNFASGYLFGIWGLMMHLVILWGVLDANFHSPIIKDLPIIKPPVGAPAKRLLLFVADGLRFRTFIENPPPYLKNVMDEHGAWGVSHTRVPTESRPGNVAIAAGVYEDPSAIFTGWKENPVDFDSVFNQSYKTWAWGSPDIVPMFAKGSETKVHGESYPAEWEDFDGSTIRLDSWVFERFSNWLETDAATVKNKTQIILFFHLLGCDTAGHASKPQSSEYLDNMKYVDQQIKEVVSKTEAFFGDNHTAYLFTADHGMTDWGSHGSGSKDETETPLVVWGAGIKNLKSRQNIEQADITPLISSLLGIPIPVNNEGVLPKQFLKLGQKAYGARALLNNIKQLVVQVTANRIQNEGISTQKHKKEQELEKNIVNIEQLLAEKKFISALKQGEKTIELAKTSLLYFRQYQRNRLMLYLTIIWVGWIAMLFLKVTGVSYHEEKPSQLLLANIGFACGVVLLLIEHKVSGSSDWRLPCYGITALVSSWLAVRTGMKLVPKLDLRNEKYPWVGILVIIFLIVTMSTGLIYRWIFGIGMLFAAAMQRILLKDSHPMLPWTAISLAVFPLLPVVEPQPRIYIVLASLVAAATTLLFNRSMSKSLKLMEALRLVTTMSICANYVDGRGWLSWIILLLTPFSIWVHSDNPKERIVGVAHGLLCPLALLSASYEPIFFLGLTAHLLCWPLHSTLSHRMTGEVRLNIQDLSRAGFLMLYTLLCFFGTGNMASISSFDPSWTRHFVTLFSPFTMAALILLKLSIPLLLVGCVSRTLVSYSIFLAVLLLGDCLALPLMYGVTSQGSWLDIGSAISRFTIAITLPCLLLLLYHLSYPLVTINLKRSSSISEKEHLV